MSSAARQLSTASTPLRAQTFFLDVPLHDLLKIFHFEANESPAICIRVEMDTGA